MVAETPRKPSDSVSLLDLATGYVMGFGTVTVYQMILVYRLRLELRKQAARAPHA